jgi:anti-sigma-K factor RskA
MSVHEQFAEDLALYALACLEGEEKALLERHLEECETCRRELEQLRGDTALLALTATGPAPPARAKKRLLNAIAGEARSRADSLPQPSSRLRIPWWASLGWIAAAGLVGIVALLWNQNSRLRHNAVELTNFAEQQKIAADRSRRIEEILSASDTQRVTVLPMNYKNAPPEGKAIYSRQHAGLIFMATNLQSLPPGKAYQLWLIPMQGAPIPAGVFKPDARGGATVMNPPLPVDVEAKAFAITIEPEQGSTTPTMPIVMMGSGT